MAANKGLLYLIGEIMDGARNYGSAGRISPQALRDLQHINPRYVDPEFLLFRHGVESRGWSKERMAETIEELLNSEKTMGVPNFMGGNRRAMEARTKPGDPLAIFAPVFPTKEGGAGLATIVETPPGRIIWDLEQRKKLLGSQRGGPSLIHGQPLPAGNAVSQLDLSAVGSQSALQTLIDRFKGGVKTAAPAAVGAGAAASLLAPDPALAAQNYPPGTPRLEAYKPPLTEGGKMRLGQEFASRMRDQYPGMDVRYEQPLEQPAFDPADILTAPVGAATWLGRGASVAAQPIIGGLLGLLAR